MCWSGKNYPKIAIIDINVFKIVEETPNINSYRSFYHEEFLWKIKERKESEINVKFVHDYFTPNLIKIYKGLHSYNHSCQLNLYSNNLLTITSINKNTRLDILYSDKSLYKLDCIIPKRSEYYVNEHGEYVSDALIPIKATSISNYKIKATNVSNYIFSK